MSKRCFKTPVDESLYFAGKLLICMLFKTVDMCGTALCTNFLYWGFLHLYRLLLYISWYRLDSSTSWFIEKNNGSRTLKRL